MKKYSLCLLSIVLISLLGGCNINIYLGLYPNEYGPSKWISEDSDSWFIVNDNGNMVGELTVGEKTINFELHIDNGPNAFLYHQGKIILQGECSLLPDQLAIKINHTQYCIYGYDKDVIVFNRISYLPSEENSSQSELASFSPPN